MRDGGAQRDLPQHQIGEFKRLRCLGQPDEQHRPAVGHECACALCHAAYTRALDDDLRRAGQPVANLVRFGIRPDEHGVRGTE